MTIPESPQTIREMRSRTRAAQRRNTLLVFVIVLLVAAAAVIYIAYRNNSLRVQAPTASTVTNPARPVDGIPLLSTSSGLQFQNIKLGTGTVATAGSTVSVHYTGWLEDGTQFDTSRDGDPFEFTLGGGRVIDGWDEGVDGMQVGGVRKLFIPSYLAYGEQGVGDIIPPNANLVFEVELLEVK